MEGVNEPVLTSDRERPKEAVVLSRVEDAGAIWRQSRRRLQAEQAFLLGSEIANIRSFDRKLPRYQGRSDIRQRSTAGIPVRKASGFGSEGNFLKALFKKEEKSNLSAMRDQSALAAGLEAALFGRMVTSDPEANTDAAVHVAHAFTVHAEATESDYFTVVDDLTREAGEAGELLGYLTPSSPPASSTAMSCSTCRC